MVDEQFQLFDYNVGVLKHQQSCFLVGFLGAQKEVLPYGNKLANSRYPPLTGKLYGKHRDF